MRNNKNLSLFSVTEHGKTQYGVSSRYEGLETIALDLFKSVSDPGAADLSYFNRLVNITEIDNSEYYSYSGYRRNEKFHLKVTIDADMDIMSIHEKKGLKNKHYVYSLNQLKEDMQIPLELAQELDSQAPDVEESEDPMQFM